MHADGGQGCQDGRPASQFQEDRITHDQLQLDKRDLFLRASLRFLRSESFLSGLAWAYI